MWNAIEKLNEIPMEMLGATNIKKVILFCILGIVQPKYTERTLQLGFSVVKHMFRKHRLKCWILLLPFLG